MAIQLQLRDNSELMTKLLGTSLAWMYVCCNTLSESEEYCWGIVQVIMHIIMQKHNIYMCKNPALLLTKIFEQLSALGKTL